MNNDIKAYKNMRFYYCVLIQYINRYLLCKSVVMRWLVIISNGDEINKQLTIHAIIFRLQDVSMNG